MNITKYENEIYKYKCCLKYLGSHAAQKITGWIIHGSENVRLGKMA